MRYHYEKPYAYLSTYLHTGFKDYFDKCSVACTDELYPTVTVQQMMRALKIKPIRKERWETAFDMRDI